MTAAFLITLREVIEGACIVAAVAGALLKLGKRESLRTVWLAAGAAVAASFLVVAGASLFGLEIQYFYEGLTEQLTEGILMALSAGFITWAVFFLHSALSKKKFSEDLVRKAGEAGQRGIFILVFTSILREGIEVAIFLSTVYLASKPAEIAAGCLAGIAGGLVVSFIFFSASYRIPVKYAFRGTSILLILFASGLLARSVHEFSEALRIPLTHAVMVPFAPASGSLHADVVQSLLGVSRTMDLAQLVPYFAYLSFMVWFVFFRSGKRAPDCDC